MKEAIAYLKSKPEQQEIWLNEDGGWMTHEHPDYPIHKTRDQLIKGAPAKDTTEKVVDPKVVDPKADPNVDADKK